MTDDPNGFLTLQPKGELIRWVTLGNPEHYDNSGVLLAELRRLARTDHPQAKNSLQEIEEEFLEEYGQKLTERLAVEHNLADALADRLSDLSTDEEVFGLRANTDGNWNYGYFKRIKE